MIEDARSLPMTANCVVPRHESLLLLDDIRDSFPGELDDAQDVLDQRDRVLAEADSTARDTVAAADAEAERTLGTPARTPTPCSRTPRPEATGWPRRPP